LASTHHTTSSSDLRISQFLGLGRAVIPVLLLVLALTASSRAQISAGGTPISFGMQDRTDVFSVSTRPIDLPALMAEDELEAAKGVPYRFGVPYEVDYSLENSGTWQELPDGSRLWRLRVECPGAYSINLVYSHYWLPEGATFFIYNEDHSMVIGAFTSANNKEYEQFSTGLVRGDVSILEYHEPAGVERPGIIEIERIIHGYKDLFNWDQVKEALGYGSSGSCNVNVNCWQGDDWQDEKRAVAMITTSGGYRLCSGALINNTSEDLTPYFLTANHCLGSEPTWVFMFNYESPGCENQNGPTWMTVSGSTLRASSGYSDFALVEMSEQAPASYQVYYAGWSRIDTPSQSSVGIHHPSGDIKKISFDNQPVTSTNYGSASGVSHWRIGSWDVGTTEGGSSGSPLFDQNHRIVGQLQGGSASCESLTSDWYGKFSKSWDYGGTASTQLSNWLDPGNTGLQTLDGLDPSGAAISMDTSIGWAPLTVNFQGSSGLDVDTWTWDFGDGDSAWVQNPTHVYDTPGTFDVSLEVTAGVETRQRVIPGGVVALADTVRGNDTVVAASSQVEMVIWGRNNMPLDQITLPIDYSGDLGLALDSWSTADCRTDYFESQVEIHSDPYGGQLTLRLISSTGQTSPDLEPGYGPLVKLMFTVPGTAQPGDSTLMDLTGYGSYRPSFEGDGRSYAPIIVSPSMVYPDCCVGIRGNVDMLGEVNVADLTYLVAYFFSGGPLPQCGPETDMDASGMINVADITYLVDYLFTGGPEPLPCD